MKVWDLKKILKEQIRRPTLKNLKVKARSVCDDHRKLVAGDIFVAVQGSKFDGHSVLNEVLRKKPSVIIVEKIPTNFQDKTTPVICVQNSRVALDRLAHFAFGEPSNKLFTVAVTGTSGKTTTSHMAEHILNKLKIATAVVGTNDHHFLHHKWEAHTTTPGSLELYGRLSEFVKLKAKGLSIEASSHALDQHRMDSLQLNVAIFTNLSRDHLDYHKNTSEYFKAKQRLFTEILKQSKKSKKFAVLNAEDAYSKKIKVPSSIIKITYGKSGDLSYKILHQDFLGVEVAIQYKKEKQTLKLKVPGHFNVLNALAAIGAGLGAGAKFSKVVQALADYEGVGGRLEPVENNKTLHVFVDYAHKPDALENVLTCLNEVRDQSVSSTNNKIDKKPKIITVFGCGGDRDPGKRPMMAKIAARLSNLVVVTSDNPRNEDPNRIIQDICTGFEQDVLSRVFTEVDRKCAFQKAIELAEPGDVILIAGKGHENYQIVGSKTLDFDDVHVMKDLLENNNSKSI